MTEQLDPPAAVVAPSTKRWYIVHAYSGMEKAVERNLRERIDRAGMQEKFGRILVPTEEVVELKNGKKSVSERRFFPGYVLVEMDMGDDTWHLVKHTAKVTGFVGGAKNRPSPISDEAGDLAGVLDQVPGVVGHFHFDEHVAGEEPTFGNRSLAVQIGRAHV